MKERQLSNTIGRKLNLTARNLRLAALQEITTGRFRDQQGSHRRTFLAQLRFEMIEHPSDELRKIEMSTPCSDGGKNAIVNAGISGSIQSLYLMALQQVNAPLEPMRTIEHKPDYNWD